jgi:hypothetical protein
VKARESRLNERWVARVWAEEEAFFTFLTLKFAGNNKRATRSGSCIDVGCLNADLLRQSRKIVRVIALKERLDRGWQVSMRRAKADAIKQRPIAEPNFG